MIFSSSLYSETGPAFHRALRTTNEQENRAHPSGDNGSVGAVPLAGKRSRTAKLYRTGSDSFSSFGITRSGLELEPSGSQTQLNTPVNVLVEVERHHILRALEVSNWVIGGRNGATRHEANLFGI